MIKSTPYYCRSCKMTIYREGRATPTRKSYCSKTDKYVLLRRKKT